MVKIQLQSFVIVCNKPQPVYGPGEIISGNCVITLNGELDLRQLEIKLEGCAEVKWTETHNKHSTTYHATHPCIEMIYSPGSGEKILKI